MISADQIPLENLPPPPPAAPIVDVRQLVRVYDRMTALSGISFTVEPGSIFGLIGPNGAGKTTLIRILATLLEPTSGDAYIYGKSVVREPYTVRRHIGYMPDFFGVYDDMKSWEYLDFYAASFDVPKERRAQLIDDLLALVDLSNKRDAYVDTLSRGMKQRLCLARALVHDPQVLLLDEPASGLDPRARIELRELLKELQRMGKTILISSHILADLAEICSGIVILEAGKIVTAGNVQEINRRIRHSRVLVIKLLLGTTEQNASEIMQRAQQILAGLPYTGEVTPRQDELQVAFGGDNHDQSQLLRELVRNDIPVVSFHEEASNLEDIFMQVTKGIVS